MGNKLSELSTPAWIVGEQEIADFMHGGEALLARGHDPESTEPALRMYSQEYVSALLAELEAKDKRIAELESCSRLEYTRRVERENAELKAKLATPVRLPKRYVISLYDDIDWEPDPNGDSYVCEEVIIALREQGFTVVEDE